MKKLVLFIVLATFGVAASAQTYQGQWLAGGDLSFNSSKYPDHDATTTFVFTPNVGYFFMNNFAGGLRINFVSQSQSGSSASSFDGGPFLRYYFLPATQKVNLFADAGAGFGSLSSTGSSSTSFNRFSIMAGPAIFLNEHVALEAAVGYTSLGGDAYKLNDKRKGDIGINVGFQIHLGSGGKSSK